MLKISSSTKAIFPLISTLLLMSSLFAQQTRVITNFDLEKYREKRIQAEQEYLQTYQKKGLPSPEEIEKISEERKRKTAEYAQSLDQMRSQLSQYFQQRADELKLQIASLDAQISYVRQLISEDRGVYRGGIISRPILAGSFISSAIGRTLTNTSLSITSNLPPNVQLVQSYSYAVPTATDIRNRVNGVLLQQAPAISQISQPNGLIFFPVIIDNTDYRNEQLLQELRTLERLRAGLAAQLSALEDQARRAGIKIH